MLQLSSDPPRIRACSTQELLGLYRHPRTTTTTTSTTPCPRPRYLGLHYLSPNQARISVTASGIAPLWHLASSIVTLHSTHLQLAQVWWPQSDSRFVSSFFFKTFFLNFGVRVLKKKRLYTVLIKIWFHNCRSMVIIIIIINHFYIALVSALEQTHWARVYVVTEERRKWSESRLLGYIYIIWWAEADYSCVSVSYDDAYDDDAADYNNFYCWIRQQQQ